MPALTLYLCMRYLSDGLHWTLPTMVLGFGGLLVLVPLGYALTFGLYGFPELGAGGLGIASAVMMWAQAIVFVLYLWRSRRFAGLRLFARFDPPHWPPIRGLLATGLPIGVTVAMEGSLFIVTALLIGRLGSVPVAAHQIAINVASLCFMIPLGLAEATTVRVGHALGRGNAIDVRRAAFAGYALALVHAVAVGAGAAVRQPRAGRAVHARRRGRGAGRVVAAVRGGVPVPRRHPGAVGRRAARAQGHARCRCSWRRSPTGASACRWARWARPVPGLGAARDVDRADRRAHGGGAAAGPALLAQQPPRPHFAVVLWVQVTNGA